MSMRILPNGSIEWDSSANLSIATIMEIRNAILADGDKKKMTVTAGKVSSPKNERPKRKVPELDQQQEEAPSVKKAKVVPVVAPTSSPLYERREISVGTHKKLLLFSKDGEYYMPFAQAFSSTARRVMEGKPGFFGKDVSSYIHGYNRTSDTFVIDEATMRLCLRIKHEPEVQERYGLVSGRIRAADVETVLGEIAKLRKALPKSAVAAPASSSAANVSVSTSTGIPVLTRNASKYIHFGEMMQYMDSVADESLIKLLGKVDDENFVVLHDGKMFVSFEVVSSVFALHEKTSASGSKQLDIFHDLEGARFSQESIDRWNSVAISTSDRL